MKKQPKGKIKNKAVRHVLRQVAQWDNCPADYQINFKQRATNILAISCGSFLAILSALYFVISFC